MRNQQVYARGVCRFLVNCTFASPCALFCKKKQTQGLGSSPEQQSRGEIGQSPLSSGTRIWNHSFLNSGREQLETGVSVAFDDKSCQTTCKSRRKAAVVQPRARAGRFLKLQAESGARLASSSTDKSRGPELHHSSRKPLEPTGRRTLAKALNTPQLPRLQPPHFLPMTSRLLRPAFRTLRGTPSTAIPTATRRFTTSSPKMTIHNITS
jgi:hypothetical protein